MAVLDIAPNEVTEVAPDHSALWRRANWFGASVLVSGIASLAVALIVVGWIALSEAGVLKRSLLTAEFHTAGPVLLAVVAMIFVADRLWPAEPRPARSRAHFVDAGYLLLFTVITTLVSLLNTGFLIEVSRHAPFLILSEIQLIPQ